MRCRELFTALPAAVEAVAAVSVAAVLPVMDLAAVVVAVGKESNLFAFDFCMLINGSSIENNQQG